MVGINTSMSGLPVEWEKRIKKHIPFTYIVDKNGRGTHGTIQDALDHSFSAQQATSNVYNIPSGIYIRGGEYVETLISKAFGLLIQGEGVATKIICPDGNNTTVFEIKGAYTTVRDLAVYSTPGEGKTGNLVHDNTQGGNAYFNVRIYGSDGGGFQCNVGQTWNNCWALSCDVDGFDFYGDSYHIVNCTAGSNGGWGFDLAGNADNSTIVGCGGYSNTSGDCQIQSVAENCVVVGNRFNSTTTITDSSGTSTVASNDLT